MIISLASTYYFSLLTLTRGPKRKVYEQLRIPTILDLDERYPEPSFPRYTVDSVQFFRASPGLLTEIIRIIDFGDSFRVGWPNNLSIDQKDRVGGFSPPENRCGLKPMRSTAQTSNLCGCIIFKIRIGSHLFPTSINTSPSDALLEIEDTLGSYPSSSSSPDRDGYANVSRKIRVPDELAKERIGQWVVKINVEPGANAEGAVTETRGLEEAGNTFAQTRPYIKPDPNLFWKPKPTIKFMYVDMLIRTHIVYIQDYNFFFLKKKDQ